MHRKHLKWPYNSEQERTISVALRAAPIAAQLPNRWAEVRISATGKRVRIFHTLRDTTARNNAS
jgi:hypothetical protein